MLNDKRGFTLRELFAVERNQQKALEWLTAEINAGRVKRYWRGSDEAPAVYRATTDAIKMH